MNLLTPAPVRGRLEMGARARAAMVPVECVLMEPLPTPS